MKKVILLMFCVSVPLIGESHADFYPLAVGNQWLYRTTTYDVGTDPSSITYSFKEVTGDTIMDNGMKYFIVSSGRRKQYERFDTLTNEIRYYSSYDCEGMDIPIYSLNYLEDSTITWQSCNYMTYQISCEPDEVSDSLIIHLDGDGLYCEDVFFKQHIGLVGQSFLEVGYSSTGLIGARIDGKVWGSLTSVEKQDQIATGFQLFQNTPNPFNPVTTIEFSLPENSKVTMRIYDSRGRLVATLLDRELEKGSHSVFFDGSASPSGIYFCHLRTTSGRTSVRKMLLIK